MKGMSNVIMGATLVMVVSLAIVSGLVLVLLAELYCSLLLSRRKLRRTTSSSNTAATATVATTATVPSSSQPQLSQDKTARPLSNFFASQGVIHAPRSFLFPALPCKKTTVEEPKGQNSKLHQILEVHTHGTNTSPHHLGILSPSSASTSCVTSPQLIQQIPIQGTATTAGNEKACGVAGGEHVVYISNPIYDNDASRPSRADTPFETPDTSPSRLEAGGSSGDEEIAKPTSTPPGSPPIITPPLSPMKKLPAEACSVSLRDARSLGTSGSESNSNNGASSSSSGSPCTSPSW